MNAIYQLLNPDNTISLNRPLAHAVGLMETVVYSALIAKWQYYSDRGKLDPDGWFYSTIADLEESTSLSDKQQKRCITVLEKRGLIKCSPRGMPAKRSFYIIDDIVHLAEILAEGEEKMKSVKPSSAEKYKRNATADEENSTPEKEETPPQTALLHCSAERAKQETPKGRNKERPNGETRNAERKEQETPKRQNMIRPNGGPCYAQTADKSKDNNLKENNPDIINPINQSGGTDEMEYIIRISALSSVTFPARGLLRSLWKCSTAADLRLRQHASFRRSRTAVRRRSRRISAVILKENSQLNRQPRLQN